MSSAGRGAERGGSSGAPGRVFGIPLGELGLFSSLLMAFSFGFLVFFATCFFAILGLLFYNTAGHHAVNMADSYRYFALPAGLVALAFALVVLLGLWVRRKVAGR
jgi:TRAP-type C4-dicarboxylate transport system permease small subunit